MAALKKTCTRCKEKFLKSEMVMSEKNSSKFYCKPCYKDANDYKDLIDYICKGFSIKAPTGRQVKDIQMLKQKGITYKEIKFTIYYIVCIKKKFLKNGSLYLVSYYLEEAREHFKMLENVRKSLDVVKKGEDEIITITINRGQFKEQEQERIKCTRYVDISKLI